VAAEAKTRVLVVDDSATARRVLCRCLQGEPDIQVIGEASDAYTANELIGRLRPDVITLDIEMPQMDGLSFLDHLMTRQPVPVVIISSHTPPGSLTGLRALRGGAIDVMLKPRTPAEVADLGRRLKYTIRELRGSPFRVRALPQEGPATRTPLKVSRPARGIIAIGTSAGGPQALEFLLAQLPADTPPVVIVQHMPALFIPLLAERLNQVSPMRVVVAAAGQELEFGVAYLAPGDKHLVVEQDGGRLRAGLRDRPPVHHHRPAVDVLFQSLVRLSGVPIVGVLLTGMGADGADGMVALRSAGHATIAEDERSCVVFGMPREAIARGGASHVVMLDQMAAMILSRFDRVAGQQHPSPYL
jgi:two-component system, chemotaxis family, protein-glutamate methylesterase/glutaminase